MKTSGLTLIVASLSVLLCAQSDAPGAPDKRQIPFGGILRARAAEEASKQIAGASNGFAYALYKELGEKEGNLFFSPSSVHMALAMTYAGARGLTGLEMYGVLHLPVWHVPRPPEPRTGGDVQSPAVLVETVAQESVPAAYKALLSQLEPGKDAAYTLHVANALWGQKGYPWLKDFLKVTRDNYGAGLREVDFAKDTEAARETINEWVEEQTKEKIKELLEKGVLKGETRLVLTNAIYFKGDWQRKFDEKNTRDEEFKVSRDKKVVVPMMRQTASFAYAEASDAQILKLPYAGGELSMVVLLPKEKAGLPALEKSLAGGPVMIGQRSTGDMIVSAWLEELRERQVDVRLPRFRLETCYYLKEPLSAMGMPDAFDPEKADFSGMNGRKDLFISAVVHKAFVEVNEEGTEAAAATGVAISVTSVQPQPPVFRADHPFLFLIRHEKTGTILFMGRVMNPKA
ncbi:MAG: serpin family protein [Planctomycetota bacterium]|jgi:serpin B